MGFRDGLKKAISDGAINVENIFYYDQFGISLNVGPPKVWRRLSQGRVTRPTPQYPKRLTVHLCTGYLGLVKAWISEGGTDDKVVCKFWLTAQPVLHDVLGGRPAYELIPAKGIALIDRLGRSGKKKNPDKQHYNPKIKRALIQRWGTIILDVICF